MMSEAGVQIEIMIIDDEPMDVEIHRIFLEQRCPQVKITAFSTSEAAIANLCERASAKERKPDLIAVDLYLGANDGIEVVQRLKTLLAGEVSAIGILTGSIAPQTQRAADEARLDFLVEKPLTAEKLSEVGAALNLFRVVQEGRLFRLIDPPSPADVRRAEDGAAADLTRRRSA